MKVHKEEIIYDEGDRVKYSPELVGLFCPESAEIIKLDLARQGLLPNQVYEVTNPSPLRIGKDGGFQLMDLENAEGNLIEGVSSQLVLPFRKGSED